MPPIVGFARTATIRAGDQPDDTGGRAQGARLAYYEYVASPPGPTIT